ncbi:Protein rhomboid [Pseudolycoriella hygida]|uniref:Protein rhomboid n=1 Tax=Pseudolycoriella hygida TaxID=35572 RepID=A0A9Q0S2H3_9DIPT|nr:Protein rhomboid [Pseudolycoriella hygida]
MKRYVRRDKANSRTRKREEVVDMFIILVSGTRTMKPDSLFMDAIEVIDNSSSKLFVSLVLEMAIMENKTDDERTAEAVVSKWKTLVRQQSTKIGALANNVVLPKNERKWRGLSHAEIIEMQNVDTVKETTIKRKSEHFPFFMISISVVQIILFYTVDEDWLFPRFAYDPHRRHEIWRFITPMLVHSGYLHLWGNVTMQLILGVLLEIVHKWKRIGTIYLASVLGASLCVTVLSNKHYGAGASGGVMGLIFAHLATIALNWNEMNRKFTSLFCVSLYIVYSVGRNVYTELFLNESTSIGHAAHFGGALTGFLVSILRNLANNVVLPKNERKLRELSKAEKMEMQNLEAQQSDIVYDKIIEGNTEHFPFFIITISLVQIILFYSFNELSLIMKLGYDPHRRHEIWRFITGMLVHRDYHHLWFNVVMQLILGSFLEIVHKWKRIGTIYLASIFGGSLCTTILDNKRYSIGASDGSMGLLFSHLATIALNWNEMDRKFTRLFCVSLYIVYSISKDVYAAVKDGSNYDVSHAAHFGGSITGFLVSILVLKNFKKHPWEEKMQKICAGILIALFLVIFVVNVTAWDYFPENQWNFDYQKSFDSFVAKQMEESSESYDDDEET